MDNAHLGEIFITPFALENINESELEDALVRHASWDWGSDAELPASGCPIGSLRISQHQYYQYHLNIPTFLTRVGVKNDFHFGEAEFMVMTNTDGHKRRTTVLVPGIDVGDITHLRLLYDPKSTTSVHCIERQVSRAV